MLELAQTIATSRVSMADDQHTIPSRTDYTVHKGEVSLAVYRKRLVGLVSGESSRPVLFLVHGSSNSALSSFDLTVPGAGEYSTMNVFAGLGFDVWTMDHENYGRSSRTSGDSDIASGVEDLIAATELVIRETGWKRMHFMGESSGALRAAAFAMVRPERVDRLVLNAFTYTGRNSPTLAKRAEQLDYFRPTTAGCAIAR
jgi:pimeloyl-ACP methyl ester carboxylesterase